MVNEVVTKAREWYARERPIFERFTESVRTTLEGLISQAGVEYLSVSARVKDPDSFAEKIERKGYQEPETQMTDIVGLRVIMYVESDANRVGELIGQWFNVHPDKSVDKRSELGKDRFGYRSVHFVCDLGERRLELPENITYRSRVFEVQVRTVLQHAWAEIQHDRSYKFTGILPPEFERHLYRQAAILEGVDREFDRLARELDEYSKQVTNNAKAGNLNIEINSTSLRSYIKANPNLSELREPPNPGGIDTLVKELNSFGITTLEQLDELLKSSTYLVDKDTTLFLTSVGAIRRAMVLEDIDMYFNSAYQKDWQIISSRGVQILKEKFGDQKVDELLQRYGIEIVPVRS